MAGKRRHEDLLPYSIVKLAKAVLRPFLFGFKYCVDNDASPHRSVPSPSRRRPNQSPCRDPCTKHQPPPDNH